MTELRYALGRRSPGDLAGDVARFWEAAETDERLRDALRDAGVQPDELLSQPANEAIQIGHEGEGFDPVTVTLIVAFAPAVNSIASSAWKDVILPWIRRRRGDDAVGPPRDGA